jgi:hypothetical protein
MWTWPKKAKQVSALDLYSDITTPKVYLKLNKLYLFICTCKFNFLYMKVIKKCKESIFLKFVQVTYFIFLF